MQTKLNFTALITKTKGKLTTPSVANRVDAIVMARKLAAIPEHQYCQLHALKDVYKILVARLE